MSADNGVYILKTRDQYRVIETQAIENVYFSFLHPEVLSDKLVPTRILEYWGNNKYTFDKATAMRVAERILNKVLSDYGICEYGIRIYEHDQTWKSIVHDAKDLAQKELHKIEPFHDPYYERVKQRLRDIVEGKIT